MTYLALFGSYARNQAKQGSDVDLYARFGRKVGLFEVLAVKHAMEDATGLKTDLIVEEAVLLHQFAREGMMNDLMVLYEDERIEDAVAE
jgi:predicted nucleotidyltransferase